MPDLNSHIAVGLGASYAGSKLLGIDTDYLIIGIIGALLSAARDDSPVPPSVCEVITNVYLFRARKVFKAALNLCGVAFFAAVLVSLLIHRYKDLASVAVPLAGLISFFGQMVIKTLSESIPEIWGNIWRPILAKLGLGGKNNAPLP